MPIQLNERRRGLLRTMLIRAIIKDARVAALFVGLDLSVDELSLTTKQKNVIRNLMPWAQDEFIRTKQDLDDLEAARVEIEGEL